MDLLADMTRKYISFLDVFWIFDSFDFYYTLFSKKPNFWHCILKRCKGLNRIFYGSFKISWYLYFRFNGNTLDAHTEEALTSTPNIESSQAMSIFSWFKEYQLYQIAVIYMSSRFFNNISQSYLPLFLQMTLKLHATYIATVPLAMFVR